MKPEEIKLLREAVNEMREGTMSHREKILFVLGVQSGLYSDLKEVRSLLLEVAEMCIKVENDDTSFNN